MKAGKTPRAWKKDPSKNRQKDKDARWTKKHGKSFYGYKNHVNADARHKLIRQYDVTDASVHDSQKFDGLLNKTNTSADVYADSAYRSAETEAKLRVRGLRSQIHQRASRNHPLSKAQENANRKKSKIRARVEHVFGAQQTSPGGRIIRTIGIARAKAKIGLKNLAYNIRRLVTLERMAAAWSPPTELRTPSAQVSALPVFGSTRRICDALVGGMPMLKGGPNGRRNQPSLSTAIYFQPCAARRVLAAALRCLAPSLFLLRSVLTGFSGRPVARRKSHNLAQN